MSVSVTCALAFNRLVDLNECYARCRGSGTDAAVAALLPRNDVASRITPIRIKRFDRASIPCECAVAHFRPTGFCSRTAIRFSRCSIALTLIASSKAASVRHSLVVHFACFVDCMFTLIGTSITHCRQRPLHLYVQLHRSSQKKITLRSSILKSHRVAVPPGGGRPRVRRPPARFSRAAAPGQASYDRVLTA